MQAITGQTLWRQLAAAPFAYLFAYSLVIVGALLNRCAASLRAARRLVLALLHAWLFLWWVVLESSCYQLAGKCLVSPWYLSAAVCSAACCCQCCCT